MLMSAKTTKFTLGGVEGYATVAFADNANPYHISILVSKEGSALRGLLDAVCTTVSVGLQAGVPFSTYLNKFSEMDFEPSGACPGVVEGKTFFTSILDLVFCWIDQQHRLLSQDEPQPIDEDTTASPSGQTCLHCGALTVQAGACRSCPNCGTSSGCG